MTFADNLLSIKILISVFFLALSCNTVLASNVAVLEFDLKDLTLNPNIKEEQARTATLRNLVVEQLVTTHKHNLIENSARAAIEADKGQGYLFDRPALAAKLGKEVGADWIVTGRLHKASFLFVYLKAQLINTDSGKIASDFVVEIKGQQKKLTIKGVESLSLQISDALGKLETD